MELIPVVTQLKLAGAGANKSPEFSICELEKGIHDLNKGRACDPSGLFSELFQMCVKGEVLKTRLLTL